MNLVYAMILSLASGLSTVLGTLFIFLKIKPCNINKFITCSLSFSIIIMIGISLTDLLPESIPILLNSFHLLGILIIIILFILSYFLIKLINKVIVAYENNLYKLGILSMITLIIHNFPEGILTFLSSYTNISLGIKLSIAIAMHNIPEGIAIAIPIYYATGSKKKAIIRTAVSGLSEPLGAILTYLFLANYINNITIAIVLVIVCGLMITLAIEGLFPEALKYKEHKYIYIGFIMGIIAIIINVLL